jgi:hypothetical protein
MGALMIKAPRVQFPSENNTYLVDKFSKRKNNPLMYKRFVAPRLNYIAV